MFILTFCLFIFTKSVYSGVAPKLTRFNPEIIQPIDSSLVLNCAAYLGSHPLRFQWFKNGLIIDNQSNRYQIDTKSDFSFLRISDIQLNDSGNYSCSVINENGLDQQWSSLQVQGLMINESPVLVKLYSQNNHEQTKGSDLVLTCNVAKGSKPFRFQWFLNGVEITGSSRSSIETKDIFSLYTLRNIDSNDMGNYSCVVSNKFGFDKLWIQLTVTGLQKFYIFSKPILNEFPISEIRLSINASYILSCTISSGSTPIFFEWFKDDHKKLSSSEYKIDNYATMSSLVFESLNRNDTGSYTCNTKNVYGSDSITTKLIIQGLI
uniref:Obscurin-like n=1 Tax=Dermatophagoides pteronyssinus TaxID=6956 RepID=A0A6P6YAE4_DERPT|nr:obscurin-like [Dermatophagoides pteronyssinus]